VAIVQATRPPVTPTSMSPPTSPPTTGDGAHHGLKKRALGFPTVLAQSVAVISPTMTAVLIIPICFADAGQGTWLAYGFGTLMLLFVVFCLNQFAKRSALPGSMYGFTAKGLGPGAGVMSGWALIWCYLFIGVAGLTGFSIFAAQLVSSMGIHTAVPPVLFFCLSAGLCWFIAYKDIKVSSLLTLVFEAASVACILALACVILFKHGFSVDTAQLKVQGMTLHDLSLAVVITVFSLVGFESATTLGGEARKPLRNIPRAVIASLLITGAFMVFMSYVEVFGAGQTHMNLGSLAAPLTFLSKAYGVSWFKVPVAIGAMVSFFSLTLSCLNAGARIIYPMGRHTVFPKALGRSHPRNHTPHVAITSFIIVILAVPCVLEIFTNPLTTFGDGGTLAAFGFLTAYYLIAIAAPFYLKKKGQLTRGPVVLAILACVALAVPTIGSFYPVPAFPVDVFPYIFLAWMAVGGSWLFALNRQRKHVFADIEDDLESTMRASVDSHNQDMGEVIAIERPLAPTFEELDLALLQSAS
jgi:amino acid transporter